MCSSHSIIVSVCIHKSINTLFPPVVSTRYRSDYLFRIGSILLFLMPTAFRKIMVLGVPWVTICSVIMSGMTIEVFRELQLLPNMIFHYLWGLVITALVCVCSVYLVQCVLPITEALTWERSIPRLVNLMVVGVWAYGSIIFPSEKAD